MKTHWAVVEGYREEYQLIETSSARICGTVSGSKFMPGDGWRAQAEETDKRVDLGRYQTATAAKVALKTYWMKDAIVPLESQEVVK